MTSANTTDFIIRDKTGKRVHTHHQHAMCKTRWAALLQFQPLEDHTIQRTWLDEEEEYHESATLGLDQFIKDLVEGQIRMAKFLAKGYPDKVWTNINRFIDGEYLPENADVYRTQMRELFNQKLDEK